MENIIREILLEILDDNESSTFINKICRLVERSYPLENLYPREVPPENCVIYNIMKNSPHLSYEFMSAFKEDKKIMEIYDYCRLIGVPSPAKYSYAWDGKYLKEYLDAINKLGYTWE